jgi:vacuolar iron transporter family protein
MNGESHHADVSGGRLRAATFGAMDGLVTNIALIAGVGGGGVGHRTLILTGVAGLVAGAISMGIGEYTSTRRNSSTCGPPGACRSIWPGRWPTC